MTPNPYHNPPETGLLGQLADFIYRAAPRPVREIAWAGAIAYLAGITGRAYNVSGTGLNQYLLLIAGTGRGKEAVSSGVEKFAAYAKGNTWHNGNMPNALPFLEEYIGPAEIASGQALIKFLGTRHSFVSIVGEFGLTLQRICHPRASSSDVMLRKVMLDVFHKSGKGNVLRPTIYSDKANNTDEVKAPAFSLFGETSPDNLYPFLDGGMINTGFLPRFLPMIYEGKREYLQKCHEDAVPTVEAMQYFVGLVDHCAQLNSHNMVVNVGFTPEAQALADQIDNQTTDQINDPNNPSQVVEFLNRVHIKTLRLAALAAVCRNHASPIITIDLVNWAHALVMDGTTKLIRKFEAGEVGDQSKSETKQQNEVRRIIRYWIETPWHVHTKTKYEIGDEACHRAQYIPYKYINQRLASTAAFKDPHGNKSATDIINRTISQLIAFGEIVHVVGAELEKITSSHAKYYKVAEESDVAGGVVKHLYGEQRRANNLLAGAFSGLPPGEEV